MAKARKPFVSRKRRKEMDAARERREHFMVSQEQERRANEALPTIIDTEKKSIAIPSSATVGEYSQRLNVSLVKIISQLMKNGVMASVNDRIDFDTISIIADEFGYIPVLQDESEEVPQAAPSNTPAIEGRDPRPPVVTIMGHVDHGKTSLLDKIRQTKVAAGEAGGITQHIGAYQAEIEYEGSERLITFLDTPGHEAFTALRSHGAQVTDIVVLVVAADDGVKPQTIEAINHAKSANVPIIVALTKIDLPDVNIERVKQQLTEYELIPEEWGGTTIMVGVSAVTGDGIKELLEYILLTADLKNYRADPEAEAQGVVIESHLETGLGAVATVLVQNGTLRPGDVVVFSETYGKIRSMTSYSGAKIARAEPSTPAQISGLQAIPEFGESFAAVKNERLARNVIDQTTKPVLASHTIGDISRAIAEGKTDTLKIILKTDTQGSLEAIKAAVNKLQEPGVKPLIIHDGIGDLTLSDVQLAQATGSIVYGFHVEIPPQIKKAASNMGVTVMTFKIIYDLLNQIELILKGLVKVEKVRVERGRLKVLKIFRTTKDAQVIGGEITQGEARNPAFITVQRESEPVGEGKITSLQKGPEAMTVLESGQEAGLAIQANTKVQAGDVIIFATEEEVIAAENSAPV